jgi:hypothetical protein
LHVEPLNLKPLNLEPLNVRRGGGFEAYKRRAGYTAPYSGPQTATTAPASLSTRLLLDLFDHSTLKHLEPMMANLNLGDEPRKSSALDEAYSAGAAAGGDTTRPIPW